MSYLEVHWDKALQNHNSSSRSLSTYSPRYWLLAQSLQYPETFIEHNVRSRTAIRHHFPIVFDFVLVFLCPYPDEVGWLGQTFHDFENLNQIVLGKVGGHGALEEALPRSSEAMVPTAPVAFDLYGRSVVVETIEFCPHKSSSKKPAHSGSGRKVISGSAGAEGSICSTVICSSIFVRSILVRLSAFQ